ncbi:hypothetical protein ACVMAJ_001765 [Bradyrhizobium sp. USDA 4448]
MKELRRFWFKFERLPMPTALNLGCGVTAHDYDDAIKLLREFVFGPNGPPTIVQLVEDVELSALERNHVQPNLGNTEVRGIWFPQGYDVPR